MVMSRRRKLGSFAASKIDVDVPSYGLQVKSGATLQATLSNPAIAVARACVGPPTAPAAAAK
jgi:hypothetical protein